MRFIIIVSAFIIVLFFSLFHSKPSFNGSAAGCAGSGCHALDNSIIAADIKDNLQVEVMLTGVGSGDAVAGELVDVSGNVVASVDNTNQNPFTLTAPAEGIYVVNAGFKSPSLKWGSTEVNLNPSGIEDEPGRALAADYRLFQNYPNPFNPATNIQFYLPNLLQINLAVYSLNGQLVRTLINTSLPAGSHTISWDGKDDTGRKVASGIFLYQLTGKDIKMAKKMFLLR